MSEGRGKIESSNLDGTDRKLIIKNLHWPQGILSINIHMSRTGSEAGSSLF